MVIMLSAAAVLLVFFGAWETCEAVYAMARAGITAGQNVRLTAGITAIIAAWWLFELARP